MPRPKLTGTQVLESYEKRREQIKKYNQKYYDARKGTPEWKEKCKEYYQTRKNKKKGLNKTKTESYNNVANPPLKIVREYWTRREDYKGDLNNENIYFLSKFNLVIETFYLKAGEKMPPYQKDPIIAPNWHPGNLFKSLDDGCSAQFDIDDEDRDRHVLEYKL
jgi:DNA repair ATPase RecN